MEEASGRVSRNKYLACVRVSRNKYVTFVISTAKIFGCKIDYRWKVAKLRKTTWKSHKIYPSSLLDILYYPVRFFETNYIVRKIGHPSMTTSNKEKTDTLA